MHRAAHSALALLLTAGACAQASTATSAAATLGADECADWACELSFAYSVADHVSTALAAHLHADAAFGASRPVPTRARATITRRWGDIIEGKSVALAWYPSRVAIGGAAGVAWSSGPSLIEDRDPNAKARFTLGGLHSVWHRDPDGIWRVLFDDGIEQKPATPSEDEASTPGPTPPVRKSDAGINRVAGTAADGPRRAYGGNAASAAAQPPQVMP